MSGVYQRPAALGSIILKAELSASGTGQVLQAQGVHTRWAPVGCHLFSLQGRMLHTPPPPPPVPFPCLRLEKCYAPQLVQVQRSALCCQVASSSVSADITDLEGPTKHHQQNQDAVHQFRLA